MVIDQNGIQQSINDFSTDLGDKSPVVPANPIDPEAQLAKVLAFNAKQKVNSLPQFRLDPPMPRDNPINQTKLAGWVTTNTSKGLLLGTNFIKKHLTRISMTTYLTQLKKTIQDFNNSLAPTDKYIVYTGGVIRSNNWIFELSLPYLTKMPEAAFNSLPELNAYLAEHPEIKHVMIPDDVMYSGQQLGGVHDSISKARNNGSEIITHYVLPYTATAAINKIKNKNPSINNYKIHTTTHLPSLIELVQQEHLSDVDTDQLKLEIGILLNDQPNQNPDTIWNMYSITTPTYFDFKTSDGASSSNLLYLTDLGIIPAITAPYHDQSYVESPVAEFLFEARVREFNKAQLSTLNTVKQNPSTDCSSCSVRTTMPFEMASPNTPQAIRSAIATTTPHL
jgi:hypothetical protein